MHLFVTTFMPSERSQQEGCMEVVSLHFNVRCESYEFSNDLLSPKIGLNHEKWNIEVFDVILRIVEKLLVTSASESFRSF